MSLLGKRQTRYLTLHFPKANELKRFGTISGFFRFSPKLEP